MGLWFIFQLFDNLPPPPSSSMPFLYDVCNVKLQWYANGFAWWKGGTHLKKTFSISYMFNSINQVFFPYLLTSTCQTRKSLWGIIWGLNHLSFHGKKYHFIYIFILAFSIGNLPIKVSELLQCMNFEKAITWFFLEMLSRWSFPRNVIKMKRLHAIIMQWSH